MKHLIVPMVFSAVVAVAGAPAALAAAPADTATKKPTKAPLDITADRLDTQNTTCIYTWTGSAEALQDTARLRADVMIAHLEVKKDNKPAGSSASSAPGASVSTSCGDVTSLDAKGHVYYVSTDGKRVHGDTAHYDAATTTYTITGDVTAVEGQNVLRGTKMVDNTQTGQGYVEGGARGPNGKNRPRAVLYPKDNNSDQAAQGQAGATTDTAAQPAKPKKKKSSKSGPVGI